MTKRFCDICGAEAIQDRPDIDHAMNVAMPKLASNGKPCRVVVTAVFTFANHPSGFGGPPDLCASCRMKLIHDLWSNLEAQRAADFRKDNP